MPFLKQLKNFRKDSVESEGKPDHGAKDGAVSLALSTTLSIVGLQHPQQLTPSTAASSCNLPKDGRLDTAQSLWDRAYDALKSKDPKLAVNYEKVLSRELSKTSPNSNPLDSTSLDQTSQYLDDIDNRIENANPQKRQEQLKIIIEAGRQRMDEKKIKYHIAGHELVLEDQIAQAAKLVQLGKDLIDEAVKASPEASMAWCGICLILPLFTQSSATEQANLTGLTYVTARMHYYVALEPLLFPKDQGPAAIVPGGLKEAVEEGIVDLYQHILEFQFRSVLRFFRDRLRNFGRDLIQYEDWDGMLSKVKQRESTLDGDFKKINDASLSQNLEELRENARGSSKTMDQLLSVTEQHLKVSEAILQGLTELRDDPKCNLPIVPSALYNSAEDQHIQPCQQGTRVSILNQITAWANDINCEALFWVYGPAGTGKSTICRSIAQSLADTGLLGASYFFRKGKEGRNSASRFFPTIASQLIATVPTFKRSLMESLEKLGNTGLETKALKEQFKMLILTPLSQVLTDTSQPILNRVIVIDALDECEGSEGSEGIKDIRIICELLSQLQEFSTVRLRVFLTSRSAYPIVGAFRSLQSKHIAYRSLSLLEDFSKETKADILTFLTERFVTIKTDNEITKDPWPDPKDLGRLITLATNPSPLFIYATTLCRFVDDGTGKKNPVNRLERWLKDCDSNASQLNQIYVPILQELSDGLDSEEKSQLLQILGSIILLPTPLPAPALAALLNMDEFSVIRWLQNLHAVLNIPSNREAPVEILHKSFSDFLLGQEGTGTAEFRVNAAESHAMLASKCIQRMENGLRKDICSVRDPGKPRDEIDKAIITGHIPPDLEYACLYWVYHLQHSGRRIIDGDEFCVFLHTHFLHWLESLGWMRKISEGILAISSLEAQIPVDKSLDLRAFVHDAKRFVLYNRSVIEQAPLQLYCSALIFAPEKSIVRRQFEKCIPTWIQMKSRVQENWTSAVQTLEGHNGQVCSIAFSPDGKQLASASEDKTVRLWDPVTGAVLQTLEGHKDFVCSIAFSPDGKQLASASDDKTVRLWDPATGAALQTLEGHNGPVNPIAFSPSGKQLASASEDETVRLWDTATGAALQTLEGHKDWIIAIAFSPDGKQLASASGDETVRLWDTATGVALQTLEGHNGPVYSIAFSPDSKQLASASDDKTVRLWDPATGAAPQTLEGHNSSVSSVAFSPDGKQLASASEDETVRLWDPATRVALQTLEGHKDSVCFVAFSPDGKQLASASEDKTVRLWDTATGAALQTLEGWVHSIAFSPDGKQLASASDDETVRLWDTATRAALQTLEGHKDLIRSIVLSPNGKQLASASNDKTVRLWDPVTGAQLQTLKGHKGWVIAIAFSPDGKQLASASVDDTIRLWDTATGAALQTFEGHKEWIHSIAFSPDGKRLASASHDKTTKLWDTVAGAAPQTLEGHNGPVFSIAFSSDGKQLASVSEDKTVRLWDTATGAALQTLEGHNGPARSIAFSPDGKQLISASEDKTVRFWDIATGAQLQTLEGHKGLVHSIAFSPDGKQLASASDDKTVRLWDPAAGAQLQTLELGITTSTLLFSTSGQHLKTDRGVLHVSSLNLSPDFLEQVRALFVSNDWIIEEGECILWLPPDYRATCVAVQDGMVVLGHSSGRISFLEFKLGSKTI